MDPQIHRYRSALFDKASTAVIMSMAMMVIGILTMVASIIYRAIATGEGNNQDREYASLIHTLSASLMTIGIIITIGAIAALIYAAYRYRKFTRPQPVLIVEPQIIHQLRRDQPESNWIIQNDLYKINITKLENSN